jgi:hypothetical protein
MQFVDHALKIAPGSAVSALAETAHTYELDPHHEKAAAPVSRQADEI